MNSNRKTGKILVLVEKEDEQIASITFELLRAGRELANGAEGSLCAIVLGHGVANVLSEVATFAEEVYFLDHPLLERFQAEFYAIALEQLFEKINPDILIIGHTSNGLELAPRLGYTMGTQVITDCIKFAVDPETRHLICTKPVYGAKFIADFKLDKKPYIVTQRAKAIEPIGPCPTRGKIIEFYPTIEESSCNIRLIERVTEDSIDLEKAEAIVAGGRGIKDVEGLKQLEEVVEVLRGYFRKVELGASRPLVDAHLVPSSRQVGLTGKKVSPELYIAVGISGSLQHLTGLLGAKKIIAINSDPKAPIFKVADYGVIGSLEEVVPAFKRKLEELK